MAFIHSLRCSALEGSKYSRFILPLAAGQAKWGVVRTQTCLIGVEHHTGRRTRVQADDEYKGAALGLHVLHRVQAVVLLDDACPLVLRRHNFNAKLSRNVARIACFNLPPPLPRKRGGVPECASSSR